MCDLFTRPGGVLGSCEPQHFSGWSQPGARLASLTGTYCTTVVKSSYILRVAEKNGGLWGFQVTEMSQGLLKGH